MSATAVLGFIEARPARTAVSTGRSKLHPSNTTAPTATARPAALRVSSAAIRAAPGSGGDSAAAGGGDSTTGHYLTRAPRFRQHGPSYTNRSKAGQSPPPSRNLSPLQLRSYVLLIAVRTDPVAELGPGALLDVTLQRAVGTVRIPNALAVRADRQQ